MYNEYVSKRRYYLRVSPKILDGEESRAIEWVFKGEGYVWKEDSDATVAVDLSQTLDELHSNLRRNWKRCHMEIGIELEMAGHKKRNSGKTNKRDENEIIR